MSILRSVVRACAVGALRERTFAQAAVYDSDNRSFADAVSGTATAPYITVYTDSDDRNPSQVDYGMGRETTNGDTRSLSLVLEMAIASAIKDTSTGQTTITIANTDQAMEFGMDILEAQAIAALWQAPASNYGSILRKIVKNVRRMPSRRGGQSSSGIRFAARRLVFVCSTIDDIVPGQALPAIHPINQFLTMAGVATDAALSEMATIIQSVLAGPTGQPLPNWQVVQGMFGMTRDQVTAIVPDGLPLPYPPMEQPNTTPGQPSFDYTDPNLSPPELEELILMGGVNKNGQTVIQPTPPDDDGG